MAFAGRVWVGIGMWVGIDFQASGSLEVAAEAPAASMATPAKADMIRDEIIVVDVEVRGGRGSG